MSDIRELYQELIVDHGRKPRNFGALEHPTIVKIGHNPLCGDELTLYLQIENGQVMDVKFEGRGCAISMASASLMTQAIKGMTLEAAHDLFTRFYQVVKEHNHEPALVESLGKLGALQGVSDYPARVKCATLAWHTLQAGLDGDTTLVSTE
ncbi:MAG: SUF system NifU family Fe-S cluster assembly protein [Gammaproteobacteria bacterium]|nr:SUF system NifU family Fe-S cluster assembly protein [Gammaproteobacteria bacterium]